MKVINKYVKSIKELNTVYNHLCYGKRNVFKGSHGTVKVEASVFPVCSAYVDVIDSKNNHTVHYTVKSEHK